VAEISWARHATWFLAPVVIYGLAGVLFVASELTQFADEPWILTSNLGDYARWGALYLAWWAWGLATWIAVARGARPARALVWSRALVAVPSIAVLGLAGAFAFMAIGFHLGGSAPPETPTRQAFAVLAVVVLVLAEIAVLVGAVRTLRAMRAG
jgi:hypothetical protein